MTVGCDRKTDSNAIGAVYDDGESNNESASKQSAYGTVESELFDCCSPFSDELIDTAHEHE